MPDTITYLFAGTIVIGIIADILAIYAYKHSTSVSKAAVKARTIAIFIMTFAFALHTSGDFFGSLYNNDDIEHNLESIAHVILAIAFFIFLTSANKIKKTASEYGFGVE